MKDVDIGDLMEAFPDSILVDCQNRKVWVIRKKNLRIYSEEYYKQLVGSMDLEPFEELQNQL